MSDTKPHLTLVPKAAPSPANVQQMPGGKDKSHVCIAIEQRYIIDVDIVLISPDKGEVFHLSLKCTVVGSTDKMWLNHFGDKANVVGTGIAALHSCLAHGNSTKPTELKKWIDQLEQYERSRMTLFMAPEKV